MARRTYTDEFLYNKARDAYVEGVSALVMERMDTFLDRRPTETAITHQLATRRWHENLLQLEQLLLRRKPLAFTFARLEAVERALQRAVGIGLDDTIPDNTQFILRPEAKYPETRQRIAGGVAIPFQVGDAACWFSIMGYFAKTRKSDGSEENLRLGNGEEVVFPVAYAVRQGATDYGQNVKRYFPGPEGTYQHLPGGPMWRSIGESALSGQSVLATVCAGADLLVNAPNSAA